MSRWFRFYDDAINDPKILKLPEAMRWYWTALLCVASKNNGELPALDDIAIQLRVTAAKATEIISILVRATLLDKTVTGFAPHNWSGRQYKSDVSTERVKRFRNGKRNASETEVERPQIQTTETDSEAKASGAEAPDHRSDLFGRGLKTLAQITGKGPDACRSFVGKCLKEAKDDAVTVLGLIDDADRNRVADPSGWIAARLKAKELPSLAPTKDEEWRTYLSNFQKFGRWRSGIGNEPGTPSCRAPAHLLREFGYEQVIAQ